LKPISGNDGGLAMGRELYYKRVILCWLVSKVIAVWCASNKFVIVTSWNRINAKIISIFIHLKKFFRVFS
jgi:hypothetical protein